MYFTEAMKDLDLHGPGQIRIVMTLGKHDEGLTQEKLAKILMVDKGSISRMIKPMISNKVIRRETDPDDRRAYIIKLTEKVQLMMPEIRLRAREWTSVLTKGLNSDEIDMLFSLLERVETNALQHLKAENNE